MGKNVQKNTKKRLLRQILFFVSAVTLFVNIVFSQGCTKREELIVPQNAVTESTAASSFRTDEQAQTLFVHVCGAVLKEGLYELSDGARISDAVHAAGGFSSEADTAYLNLAAVLSDGMQIRVPVRGEVSAGTNQQVGLINLNTATLADLCMLSGIGESKAGDIIAYRESKGPFKSVEELMNISGIGEKLFEKIKDKITV